MGTRKQSNNSTTLLVLLKEELSAFPSSQLLATSSNIMNEMQWRLSLVASLIVVVALICLLFVVKGP
jgi:hypothetical protein